MIAIYLHKTLISQTQSTIQHNRLLVSNIDGKGAPEPTTFLVKRVDATENLHVISDPISRPDHAPTSRPATPNPRISAVLRYDNPTSDDGSVTQCKVRVSFVYVYLHKNVCVYEYLHKKGRSKIYSNTQLKTCFFRLKK